MNLAYRKFLRTTSLRYSRGHSRFQTLYELFAIVITSNYSDFCSLMSVFLGNEIIFRYDFI